MRSAKSALSYVIVGTVLAAVCATAGAQDVPTEVVTRQMEVTFDKLKDLRSEDKETREAAENELKEKLKKAIEDKASGETDADMKEFLNSETSDARLQEIVNGIKDSLKTDTQAAAVSRYRTIISFDSIGPKPSPWERTSRSR